LGERQLLCLGFSQLAAVEAAAVVHRLEAQEGMAGTTTHTQLVTRQTELLEELLEAPATPQMEQTESLWATTELVVAAAADHSMETAATAATAEDTERAAVAVEEPGLELAEPGATAAQEE
jgi:hypothetical protein